MLYYKKLFLIITTACFLISCSTLPESGPSYSSIMSIKDQYQAQNPDSKQTQAAPLDVIFFNIDNQIVKNLSVVSYANQHKLSTLAQKTNQQNDLHVVGLGDVLDISIWEAPPAVLFTPLNKDGSGNSNVMQIPNQEVNKKGYVSIPFIDDVKVSNKSIEDIQKDIQEKLSKIANNPQVIVRLVNNSSSNVTVFTHKGGIKIPLTAYGERVLDAVSKASNSIEDSLGNIKYISVQLTRNNTTVSIPLDSIINDSRQNIKLMKNDIITIINRDNAFISMGALGKINEVRYESTGINLSQALARTSGLTDDRADAKGVFVFRYQQASELNQIQAQSVNELSVATNEKVPVVYQLDLSDPRSLFLSQKFPINNNDIIYVSNAPLSELQKIIRVIFNPAMAVERRVN